MELAHNLNKKIGVKIKKVREKNNIKQEWLARKVGSGKSEISRIENGKRSLSILKLNQIAQALNTPLSYFIEQD